MQLDPSDPAVLLDPVASYADSPVARMPVPGLGTLWIVTRHEFARSVLTDPRFRLSRASYSLRPAGLPDTPNLGELDGPDHTRLRRLVSPAFTARRAAEFRPRVEHLAKVLLDRLADSPAQPQPGEPTPQPAADSTPRPAAASTTRQPANESTPQPASALTPRPVGASTTPQPASDFTPRPVSNPTPQPANEHTPRPAADSTPSQPAGDSAPPQPAALEFDLLRDFAWPLPIEVICELVGIAEADRPLWRRVGMAVVSGQGQAFQEAIPEVIAGAGAAVARRRQEPGDDLLGDLVKTEASDEDLVVLVWHLVLAGQVPGNLIANAVEALLKHPEQLRLLRNDPSLMPRAVEELLRWCTPQLLTTPRFTTEDLEIGGVPIPKGEPVSVSMLSANRDPAVFPDPDRLDLTRAPGSLGHLAFAHGPHFCLGAALARVETEVALAALIDRFPDMSLAADPVRTPDPGTWRLASLRLRAA